MAIEVLYPTESLIPDFWKVLDIVAKEKIFLEMVEAPSFEKVLQFQRKIIGDYGPVYYAAEHCRTEHLDFSVKQFVRALIFCKIDL